MMEALKSWAMAVCVAAVAGSILHLAAPEGASQKVLKLTVSLFFLCAILSPVLTGGLAQDWEPPPAALAEGELNTEQLEEQLQRQVEESFVASIRREVEGILAEFETSALEISINVNTQAKDSISITEITLLLEEAERGQAEQISARVTEQTGKEPVLLFAQGERPPGEEASGSSAAGGETHG